MSLLYLYALAPEPPAAPLALGVGLAGEPLRAVACGPLQALVGELRERPHPGPETLAGHDAAVRRLAEALPALLPARFGEWAPDERALAECLGPQAGELGEALALVRGCVQMTLRVFGSPEPGPSPPVPLSHPHSRPPGEGAPPPEDSPAPSGPGTRYLAARRRALAEAQEVPEIAGLRAALLPLLRAERVERHGTGALLATLSHLVERERLPSYLELFETESRRLADVRVAASGPWPPYAFAPGEKRLMPADPPELPYDWSERSEPEDHDERSEPGERLRLEIAEVEALRAELEQRVSAEQPRWNANPEEVQRSVARLVLTLVEFLRKLMERQAIRRMEADTLTPEEIEALGLALMRLEETVHDMAGRFGLEPTDLNLDLGPLGRLL